MAQLCAVCETTEAKYKCPTCRVPYCSLVCCKEHKKTPCEPVPVPKKPQEPPTSSSAIVSEDMEAEKLTNEQMEVLQKSVEVKKMLKNSLITQTLIQIDTSQNKMKALEKALLDPIFAKFMYQALDEVVPAK
ncbi:unnamed protein product [Peronospora belbahrii]|uniref:HIT-type domain-containing protein n=1 Tax=Peronospora belbahrii TaxID=622444 RepID=A0AAU9KQT2_9STRA|nr:unnamed protein product [Peronospora belbahrii]CAH0520767.1 unnamed protein product [Peronospora belbahrii]